jgi:hypothetical protein
VAAQPAGGANLCASPALSPVSAALIAVAARSAEESLARYTVILESGALRSMPAGQEAAGG